MRHADPYGNHDQASDGGAEQWLAVKTARRECHNTAGVVRLISSAAWRHA